MQSSAVPYIRLSAALDQMRDKDASGQLVPFDIDFVTHDRKRATGGKLICLRDVIRTNVSHDHRKHGTISVTHPANSDHVYTVHTWLILRFNGQEVLL